MYKYALLQFVLCNLNTSDEILPASHPHWIAPFVYCPGLRQQLHSLWPLHDFVPHHSNPPERIIQKGVQKSARAAICAREEGWSQKIKQPFLSPIATFQKRRCFHRPSPQISRNLHRTTESAMLRCCPGTVFPVLFTRSMLMGVMTVASTASRGWVANIATNDLAFVWPSNSAKKLCVSEGHWWNWSKTMILFALYIAIPLLPLRLKALLLGCFHTHDIHLDCFKVDTHIQTTSQFPGLKANGNSERMVGGLLLSLVRVSHILVKVEGIAASLSWLLFYDYLSWKKQPRNYKICWEHSKVIVFSGLLDKNCCPQPPCQPCPVSQAKMPRKLHNCTQNSPQDVGKKNMWNIFDNFHETYQPFFGWLEPLLRTPSLSKTNL